MDEEEIEKQCEELREKLLAELEEPGGSGGSGQKINGSRRRTFKAHQVHEQAEAKIEETERLRRALGISADYQEGGHWKKQEERLRKAVERDEEKQEE